MNGSAVIWPAKKLSSIKLIVLFQFAAGNNAYILVDDITVSQGSCSGAGYLLNYVQGGAGGGNQGGGGGPNIIPTPPPPVSGDCRPDIRTLTSLSCEHTHSIFPNYIVACQASLLLCNL